MFYVPQRKIGRNQKWRRLCKLVQIVRRLNDVLYCIRSSPRAPPIIAHIDRLRPFDGEPPASWASVINRKPSTDPSIGIQKSSTGDVYRPACTETTEGSHMTNDSAAPVTRSRSTDAPTAASQERSQAERRLPAGHPARRKQAVDVQESAGSSETGKLALHSNRQRRYCNKPLRYRRLV